MDAEKPAMTPQDFRFIANAIEHCRARSCPNCQGFLSADTTFKLREYADLAERALAAPPSETPPGNEIIADLIDWVIVAFLAGWVLSGAFVFYEWFRSSRSLYK